ncbi:MAG: mechanosensitive ion channel [Polyangiaceae bacterium]
MSWLKTHINVELFRISDKPVTVAAIFLLLTTLVLVVFIARITQRGITRLIERRDHGRAGLGYAIGKIAQYAVLLIGTLVALQNVGIELSALAALGAVIGVGIGLGLQGIMQNFVSGLILLFERHIQKGDFIVIGDTTGRVVDIAIRSTTLLTRTGILVVVPNSELVGTRVSNLTQPSTSYRTKMVVGVAYGSDTRKVQRVLHACADRHPKVLKEPAPTVLFTDFADSSLLFTLVVTIDDASKEPDILSDLRFDVDASFRENKVEIPFPQRDIHIKSKPAA